MVQYRGEAWSNQRLTGVSQLNRSLTFALVNVLNEKEVSFTYIIENNSILARLTMNASGQFETLV